MLSGHPIFIGFCKLMGCQRDPHDRGITPGHMMVMCIGALGMV